MPDIQYIDKKKSSSISAVVYPTPNISNALVRSCIKTDIAGDSCKVVDVITGKLLHHILLKNVLIWNVDDKLFLIKQVDNIIPLSLNFTTNDEAINAEIRFTNIFNGQIIS